MTTSFKCDECDIQCERPTWEYNRTIHHFCSQECAKSYRASHVVYPKKGSKFGQVTFLRKGRDAKGTYYICKCDCGEETAIRVNKWKVIKTCGNRTNHKAEQRRNFKGYKEISLSYWNSIVVGAQNRNLKFSIDIQYAWRLFKRQNRRCALTGVPLNLSLNAGHEKTASLDRIDSSKGYIKRNVQWVDKTVNRLKMDLTDEQFINVCKKVAGYANKR